MKPIVQIRVSVYSRLLPGAPHIFPIKEIPYRFAKFTPSLAFALFQDPAHSFVFSSFPAPVDIKNRSDQRELLL